MASIADETDRFLDAWMRVRQIVQAANFNRFHREGLSATQFMTMNVIPEEGMTLSELARKLNLSAATLNETVNSLQERGLVSRSKNASDARKVDIRATAAGSAMQNQASAEFHGFMAELFSSMSRTKRAGLLAGLEEMVRRSEGGREKPEAPSRRDAGGLPAKRSSRRSRPA